MKDLLDIAEKLRTGSAPTIWFLVMVVVAYSAYFGWKNYFSEAARLEIEKKRLEVQKLRLEMTKLNRDVPAPAHSEKEVPVAALPSARPKIKPEHPRNRWRIFAVAFSSALVFPIINLCYIILHLPQPPTIQILQVVCWLHLGVGTLTGVIAGMLALKFSPDDVMLTLIIGLILGFFGDVLGVQLFGLSLRIYAVFRNASFRSAAGGGP